MKKKVLVIEDDRTVLMYVLEVLREAGLEAVGTASGLEALELTHAEQPDLVVVDYYVPGTDGLRVLEALRSNPKTHAIPVLFVSSDDHPRFLRKLRQAGVNSYLMKPFLPEELVRQTRQLLGEAGGEA